MIAIDVGASGCKLALRDGSRALRLVVAHTPGASTGEGALATPELLAATLRSARREHRIRDRACTLVLPPKTTVFRRVAVPAMSDAELELNLPYEFRDYVASAPADYRFDYAVDEVARGEDGATTHMELLAAAAPRELLEGYAAALRRAGLRARAIVPAQMAYRRLVASREDELAAAGVCGGLALVDVGQQSTTVTLFHQRRYHSQHDIGVGCELVDSAIATEAGVDERTASSYKLDDRGGVLASERCRDACARIAFEVSKVIGFHDARNPGDVIGHLCLLGGGALVGPLARTVARTSGVRELDREALLPPVGQGQELAAACALAVGGLLEGELI